ncbi:aldo/keto reductase [Parapedobacter sp.]
MRNNMAMQRKKLGHTDIEVSEIAFGGVEIGMPYGIGVKGEADMLAEREAVALLHRAIEARINFFDTARLYGESERIMGRAFRDRRQEVVLASKCRHLRRPNGTLVPRTELEAYIRGSLQESLQTLQTDYIDLYMVHYADREILEIDEVISTFTRLRDEGLVRAIGVSVYKPDETQLTVSAGGWDAIQLPFNLMDQSHGVHFEQAFKQGVGIIVRSVLMRGMLTDGVGSMHPALHDVEQHIKGYRALLGQKFTGLPQFATQFALAHEAVSAVLVGIDKPTYLEDAVACANARHFDEALLAQARAMKYPRPAELNLAEWDKNGWL